MDQIVDDDIESYLQHLQRTKDPVLLEMEARATASKFPIIGPMVGRLCQQVAQAIGARDVFEMGSGFGYSTWWFAQAVGPGGRVVHTDGDAKQSAEAKGWLDRAGAARRGSRAPGAARAAAAGRALDGAGRRRRSGRDARGGGAARARRGDGARVYAGPDRRSARPRAPRRRRAGRVPLRHPRF